MEIDLGTVCRRRPWHGHPYPGGSSFPLSRAVGYVCGQAIVKESAMIELTEEQRQAVEQAGDEPPTVVDAKTQTAYVLVRKTVYDRVRELLEDEKDRKLQEGWQK